MQYIHVFFHPEALFEQVANTLAIAAGAKYHFVEISGVATPRVNSLRTCAQPDNPGLVRIEFWNASGEALSANYHFEFGKGGRRGMLLPESPQWLALAKAVVEQLGGAIELERDDFWRFCQHESRWPEDAEESGFAQLMHLVASVRQVTQKDIEVAAAELKR